MRFEYKGFDVMITPKGQHGFAGGFFFVTIRKDGKVVTRKELAANSIEMIARMVREAVDNLGKTKTWW